MTLRLRILMLLAAAALAAAAQEAPYKFDIGASVGMSGYLGDANRTPLFHRPGFTAEAGMRYIPNVRWAFRGALGVTTLSGNTADMDNVLPGQAAYSFKSTVYSLEARAEFNFLPYGMGESYKKLRRWTPYLTLGVGACLSSSQGSTAVAPTLPMGVGVKFKARPRLNLIAEFTMTKTFSDKVDGPYLGDLTGIATKFFKDTDWYSRLTVGITWEFGERCEKCNYVD